MKSSRIIRRGRAIRSRRFIVAMLVFASTSVALAAVFVPRARSIRYIAPAAVLSSASLLAIDDEPVLGLAHSLPTHLPPPAPLKAIYMSQCVAGTPGFRDRLIALAGETEINAVVIDIKDYSGGISFPSEHPELAEMYSERCFVPDMRELVEEMHRAGIYVIGRITVFQDPLYAKKHSELAVTKASATSTLWADHKGLHFIDVGAEPFWRYIVIISEEAFRIGFDELNYDYIRYPSDGNMKDIYYPWSGERIAADPENGKAKMLRDFFLYVNKVLTNREVYGDTRPLLSADLFGMTMTNTDDLNIGQVLEYAAPYFDYIAPMVYPSHYPRTFHGYANPAAEPYGVIAFSMGEGVRRIEALAQSASTTPWAREAQVHKLQLRPWLQDFDLGAIYTPEMVRAQIRAVYDSGLTSWMLWDPANTYTREALDIIINE